MMDFLDLQKSRAHTIRLYVGYVLLAIAILMAVYVLRLQAEGYGLDNNGQVIQNGVVFVSSAPGGAAITFNGERASDLTRARLSLPSGTYTMRLTRDGYREWQRALTMEGGGVEHVDYPLLIPTTLTPAAVEEYPADTSMMLQSPDRRWVMLQVPGEAGTFDVYDVKDPEKVGELKTRVSVPTSLLSLPVPAGQQPVFELAEWSRDNDHILLRHTVGQQSEYILLSRSEPETSVNLTSQLQLKPGVEVTMRDKKFDRYFLHDTASRTLSVADLEGRPAAPLLSGVVSYKSYGEDVVLYASDTDAEAGKVAIKLYQFGKSYPIRQLSVADSYLLDLSTYGDDWYAAVGSPADNNLYIYRNASQRLRDRPEQPLAPTEILKVDKPSYLEFSANSQFVMVENGRDIAIYDVENEKSYTYALAKPIDAPQQHVTWMDGFHLMTVSGGVATIFDYDGTNVQSLSAANPSYVPLFDTSYRTLYTMTPAKAAAADKPAAPAIFQATPLRTERDR